MARIVSICRGAGKINPPTNVDCVYNVGNVAGEKLLSLVTKGSDSRQEKGSTSQTLHIDRHTAQQLVQILTQEFDL